MAKRILLVDDDAGFILATQRLLEVEGYDILTANSAAAARSQLDTELPDLVLLDVIMPGKDGFAFAEELSKDKRLAGIPVVLVTAVADNPGQMMEAFAKGDGCTVCDVLPKSVVHEQLCGTVAKALRTAE